MIIIASDYDGTLNHHGVSDGDKEAIKKFREAGNKFGIVTGRDLEMATWVIYDLEKIGVEIDFVICCTGGIILSFDGEIKSVKKQKTGEYINEILNYARTLSLGVFRVSNEMTTCYADRKNRIKQDFSAISELTQANAWFEKEEDADACENKKGDPKFKPGDKVVLKYEDETPVMTHVETFDQIRDYTMTVKTVKAVKAPDWADAHWYDYECELPGNRIIELHERELRRS